MASIWDWSRTPASNGNSDSAINWAEGMAPSAVNNSSRQEMARVAEYRDDQAGLVTVAGTADAITATTFSAFIAYANGLQFSFVAASDNTGAVTLNANSIGVKSIRKFTRSGEVGLQAGDIQATGVYRVTYRTALNGGSGGWHLDNPSSGAYAGFCAHRNGSDQNPISSATYTKYAATTEAYDIGGHYDATNSRWTPPAGLISITGTIQFASTNIVASSAVLAAIYKNGSIFRQGPFTRAESSGATAGAGVTIEDEANGADYYEFFIRADGAGNKVANGAADVSYWCGHTV